MTSRLSRVVPAGCVLVLLLHAAPVLAAPGPIEKARQALSAGKLDEVLFALDGQKLEGQERVEAAQLLAHAGRKSFEKKEKDASAADELAEKAAAQHMQPHGVPVIDVNGRLVVGFNQPLLAQLLHIRG